MFSLVGEATLSYDSSRFQKPSTVREMLQPLRWLTDVLTRYALERHLLKFEGKLVCEQDLCC